MEKNKTNEKSKINNLLLTWIKDITHMSNFWDAFLMESKHLKRVELTKSEIFFSIGAR